MRYRSGQPGQRSTANALGWSLARISAPAGLRLRSVPRRRQLRDSVPLQCAHAHWILRLWPVRSGQHAARVPGRRLCRSSQSASPQLRTCARGWAGFLRVAHGGGTRPADRARAGRASCWSLSWSTYVISQIGICITGSLTRKRLVPGVLRRSGVGKVTV